MPTPGSVAPTPPHRHTAPPLPSYPRLPRVSRRDRLQLPHTPQRPPQAPSHPRPFPSFPRKREPKPNPVRSARDPSRLPTSVRRPSRYAVPPTIAVWIPACAGMTDPGTRVGCCSRRDTRGKRGYDGVGAGVTEWGAGVPEGRGAERRILRADVGCRSRRDTRGKRGYDGEGSAGMVVRGAGATDPGDGRWVLLTSRYPRQARV